MMPRRDPAKAVQVLDMLLEFFDGGWRWIKGGISDPQGNRCLLGALHHIRAELRFRGDGTLALLLRALSDEQKKQTPIGRSIPESLRSYHLAIFNDRRSTRYKDVRALILKAREIALADAGTLATVERRPAPLDLGLWSRPNRNMGASSIRAG